jgi:hypothetical protein
MAEVVKSERSQPGSPAMPEKGFRHPVRLPRCGAIVVAEDERLAGQAARGGRPVGEQLAGLFIEIDDVSAFRLRRREASAKRRASLSPRRRRTYKASISAGVTSPTTTEPMWR